ncbi:MAG: hypothetical protein KKC39_02665 [Candidatus Omnitrophica bacterium]|nr:hypothetical protein [Candidatus Omnitrophota bacterium]MBU4303714.1 hypothetical protein [Candidatus Omnitrophota bacterium]MBU4419280.1 hypothetical protein [Candidatus Omnitrophota bacterium]MBU4467632.1 hypothetical protein [Candidatus Omnitrophota bacterium]MCG2707700.1 hypothetical protein [Candidatus Omnitrophota bacterium]
MKIILCCLLTIILMGCSTLSDNPRSVNTGRTMLEPQSILKFSDVPVPVGLKSLPQQSYSFESSGVRVGVLKYRGKNNPDQIVNFYKEQMPMYNWNLVNIVEYGQRMLNFERENETCIITLQPLDWNNNLLQYFVKKYFSSRLFLKTVFM